MNSKKIKVMHIINSYSLAGAEKLVYDILLHSDTSKFDMSVCSIRGKNDIFEKNIRATLESKGIKTFTLNKPCHRGRIRGIIKLISIISSNRIDIINTHCSSPDFYGRIAAYFSGVSRVFTTIHSTSGYKENVENVFKHVTSKYIAISEQVKKYIIEDLNISEKRIKLIYNGIGLMNCNVDEEERNLLFNEIGIKSDSIVITNVGRIVEQKGQLYLVRAAKAILQNYPKVQFLIIGDDKLDKSFADNLKNIVNQERLENEIIFTGVRDDIYKILGITDVFIFPSLCEGLSLAVLEAMSTGIPIVATDVGSIREVIVDGESGLIIPPKDVDSIIGSIEYLLSNHEKAVEMGIRARERITKRFSITNTAREYERLYIEDQDN